MKKIVIALLVAFPAHSGLWPIATSFDVKIISASSARYENIVWEYLEAGASTEQRYYDGKVAAFHRHNNPSGGEPSANIFSSSQIKVDQSRTIGQWARGMSLPPAMGHDNSANGGECIGVAYFPVRTASGEYPFSSVIFPPGSCTYAPPGNNWCHVQQPSLTLDHGQLIMMTGAAIATTTFTTVCTAPMSIKIKLGQDSVDLRNGMYSKLKVEGDIGGVHRMNAGSNQRDITSTVNTDLAKEPGPFNGSSVIYIEYY